MTTMTMVPLRALQASERQTLRLLSLSRSMAKLLRQVGGDGAASLVEKFEAIEAGMDHSDPGQEYNNRAEKAQGESHEQD
ncbi:MAG: hypothetical protein KKC99_07445 [Proteobacteria bacterium]|nr:hypothetical protein [Pseudomonadota bacterium]